LIQSCIEKYSSIEVNLDPVENECGPYPKFKHIMSFLKIKDPSKRDKFVPEYIKTKNKIQNDFRSEPLGEQLMCMCITAVYYIHYFLLVMVQTHDSSTK